MKLRTSIIPPGRHQAAPVEVQAPEKGQSMNDWIRTIDRRPEHGQRVLLTVHYPAELRQPGHVSEAEYDDGRHMRHPKPRWLMGGRVQSFYAGTHWMPMPEPAPLERLNV